jgi:hypothetical protein
MLKTSPENSVNSQKSPPVKKQVTAARPRCRFDMFVMLRNDVNMTFANGSKEWCFRGDKYSEVPKKMLTYLLGIVKNHSANYYLMELYDNTKPRENGERLIFKILNNTVKVSRLMNYPELLQNFSLPEWLSYEITD